ncbi:unnamed protein product [Brugia pahangi]|uniref:Uncharacterized protein n=1 Tax=Brugia pahangi TaxID=6280 RepID=A0A0N4TV63_BRUPA|nr:unnamed protein product [Brugia pahangi]
MVLSSWQGKIAWFGFSNKIKLTLISISVFYALLTFLSHFCPRKYVPLCR